MKNYLKALFNLFFFSGEERECLWSKKEDLNFPKPVSERVILVDLPHVSNQLVHNMAIAKSFSEASGGRVEYYVPNIYYANRNISVRVFGKFFSMFLRSTRFARKAGVFAGLSIDNVTPTDVKEAHKIKCDVWNEITSKQGLIDFNFRDVSVGKAVYDTYLRVAKMATVDLSDKRLGELLFEALLLVLVAERYFRTRKVSYVLLGHSVYVNWQIVSDLAIKYGARVFVTFNARFPPLHCVNDNRGLQTVDHTLYRELFASLSSVEQKESLVLGKNMIEGRIKGILDDGVGYMARSAYSGLSKIDGLDSEGGRRPLIFMLHSFSDSPHVYNDMVFPDFWEWLVQSLAFIEKNRLYERYDVLLKPHPNRFRYEDAFIAQIQEMFVFSRILDENINNRVLGNCNVAAVISVYGSVAPEFTAMGVPVILCGDNPTAAYDFAFNAKSKDEYFELIRCADELEVNPDKVNQIYEFMYMHFLRGSALEIPNYPFKRWRRGINVEGFDCRYSEFSYSKFSNMIQPQLRKYI